MFDLPDIPARKIAAEANFFDSFIQQSAAEIPTVVKTLCFPVSSANEISF
jgi:hypothetical protein